MDSYRLTGGSGTTIDIGSYVLAEPGPDFDFGALFQQQFITNPVAEGGVLAYEAHGVRKFQFPLRLASSGAFTGGLNGLEALLRTLARPGAIIDLQPDGTPTAEAVRFDVLAGRMDDHYMLPMQRIGRREVALELTVRPFGYWPTAILLASALSPSYQDTFQLTWNPASVIGDAAAQAIVAVHASVATTLSQTPGLSGNRYKPDGLWWSLARPSGATHFMVPSDFGAATFTNQNAFTGSNNILAATVGQLNLAPFGAYLRLDLMPSGADSWKLLAARTMDSTRGQLYSGRYRVFGFFRWWQFAPSGGVSATMPMQVLFDEGVLGAGDNSAMGSAYPVATLIPMAPTSVNAGGIPTPWSDAPLMGNATWSPTEPIFQIVDFGEHTLPANASGAWAPWSLRVWGRLPTSFMGTYPRLDFGGIRLQALDGPAGVVPKGLIVPTTFQISGTAPGGYWSADAYPQDTLVADAISNRVLAYNGVQLRPGSSIASPGPEYSVLDFRRFHLGALPHLHGTEMQLDVGVIDRLYNMSGATAFLASGSRSAIAASVHYRPRFSFLKGI